MCNDLNHWVVIPVPSDTQNGTTSSEANDSNMDLVHLEECGTSCSHGNVAAWKCHIELPSWLVSHCELSCGQFRSSNIPRSAMDINGLHHISSYHIISPWVLGQVQTLTLKIKHYSKCRSWSIVPEGMGCVISPIRAEVKVNPCGSLSLSRFQYKVMVQASISSLIWSYPLVT